MLKKPPLKESVWSIWWNTIDRHVFIAILLLIAIGVWLIMAVSPSVALQHHWTSFVLLKRHFAVLGPGVLILFLTTCCKLRHLKTLAYLVGFLSWMALWVILAYGQEIKGAKRWLSFCGFSLQPSEFLKPALAIMVADILSKVSPWKFFWTVSSMAIVLIPLFLQPDLGMIFLISAACLGQCFIAGLPWVWTGGILMGAMGGCVAIYACFPHAAYRIKSFLAGGAAGDPFGSQYQILQALKSFSSGGLLGVGPGAGTVLNTLPDGHADFIFAVAGEELGLIACLIILALYGFIFFRCLWHCLEEIDLFYAISIVGLTLQFALQVIFNIASVLHLIPTKGVTLPFMSYGGSSFLSLCWSMGMLIMLTRRYREIGG